jgi:hypothetical protein
MTDQLVKDPTTVATEQIITQVKNAWAAQNKAVTDLLNKHSDDVLMQQIAPGRNRGIYLLGHLTAVNDGLLPLFGLGDKLYPQLEKPFLAEADSTTADMPSVAELRQYWETINNTLTDHFNKMTANDWLGRHTRISEEDFVKEPMRNKLNVIIGRTNHQSYHVGQLALLNPKN